MNTSTNYHPGLKPFYNNKDTIQLVDSQSTREHTTMTQLSSAGLLPVSLLLLLTAAAAVSGPPSPQYEVLDCQNDLDALLCTCEQYIQKKGPKQKPSSECCRTVQVADAHPSCICNYLGSAKMSMEKVFYVINQCGVTIPAGCGSKQI